MNEQPSPQPPGPSPQPARPLPDGNVAGPLDVLFLVECAGQDDHGVPTGMHAGYVRICGATGEVSWFGFDGNQERNWDQIERLNPAVIKLARRYMQAARALRSIQATTRNVTWLPKSP